jgi:hypothetical protein
MIIPLLITNPYFHSLLHQARRHHHSIDLFRRLLRHLRHRRRHLFAEREKNADRVVRQYYLAGS